MKGKQRVSTALGWYSSTQSTDGIKKLSLWAAAPHNFLVGARNAHPFRRCT